MELRFAESEDCDRQDLRRSTLCTIIQKLGPLAQLVERLHGMQEVSGSIPLRSRVIFASR